MFCEKNISNQEPELSFFSTFTYMYTCHRTNDHGEKKMLEIIFENADWNENNF